MIVDKLLEDLLSPDPSSKSTKSLTSTMPGCIFDFSQNSLINRLKYLGDLALVDLPRSI